MRTRFFADLYRRNPLLTFVGWLHVLAFVATFGAFLTDDRLVMGISAWIKPMKFMLSITIFLWTIAWFTRYIRRPRWAMKTISVVISVSILIESACILLQAARGTRSHFNFTTDFDAAIFQAMGVMIGINLLMVLMILFLFGRSGIRLPPVYLWGIRAGIVLFLVGGAIGGLMIGRGAHAVGVPDGGPGLPFFNWSTVGGDLRIAHGLALHALQILPLTGFALSRWARLRRAPVRLVLLGGVVALYGALVYAALRQALAGEPFI